MNQANNPEHRWGLIMVKPFSDDYSARNNEAGAVSDTVNYIDNKIEDHDTKQFPINADC